MALRPQQLLRRYALWLELHAPLSVALLCLLGLGGYCAWTLRAPLVALFVALGTGLALFLAVRGHRHLERELEDLEAAQARAAAELDGLRVELARRGEEMIAAAQRIGESVEQITQLARQPVDQAALSIETSASQSALLAERAAAANDFTDSARLHAEQGVRVVVSAGLEIAQVSEIVETSAQTLQALSEKIANIGSIVDVIKDVADQTRLLSMNAAIEATRAGRFGGGFTAVANAVRQLADRTAQSTRQVGTLIQGINRETQRAVSTMQKALQGVASSLALSREAGQVLEQIHDGATRTATTVRDIAASTSELKAASLQLAKQISAVAMSIRNGNRLAQRAASDARELVSGLGSLRGLGASSEAGESGATRKPDDRAG